MKDEQARRAECLIDKSRFNEDDQENLKLAIEDARAEKNFFKSIRKLVPLILVLMVGSSEGLEDYEEQDITSKK